MTQDKKVYYDLAYIVSCALKEKQPNLQGVDLEEIYKVAKKSSILPLLGKVIPQYSKEFYSNVYRIENFEKYKAELYDYFDNNQIKHCSLKGMVTKNFYPQSAMRYMADYDVLFDPEKKKEVRQWFEEHGVEILYYREIRSGEKEDSVLFNKQYHFELHYCLFNGGDNKKAWYQYFSNDELFKRLIHVSGFEYRMTGEDFYLFFLIHAYKHSAFVCDFRELIDCYLINRCCNFNRNYVDEKLKEFGFSEFEFMVRTVGRKALEGEQLSIEEEQYFLKCASNGTFGDPELNELRRMTTDGNVTKWMRILAIRKMFIVPKDSYKSAHPIVYYSLLLRPLYHLWHIVLRMLDWKETKRLIYKYYHAE